MKPNKKNIQKWIDALRSEKFKQGFGCLENFNHEFCCLGLACKIFIQKNKQNKQIVLFNNQKLIGGTPEDQESSPFWLKEINSDFSNKTGRFLIDLNDSKMYNFNEIADLLQAVYIENVLD